MVSRVEQVLEEKGKTAYWLAKQMGISPQMVYMYIRLEKTPSLKRALQMAKILECKVDDLFELDK